jgi:nitric oxide reductase NorE protein
LHWSQKAGERAVHGTELPSFVWADRRPSPALTDPPAERTPGIPGEVGIWIFLLGDMTIFGAFFAVFLWEGRKAPELFARSTLELHQGVGAANTVVLLLSSYLVVVALDAWRRGRVTTCTRVLWAASGCGVLFALLKLGEYASGIDSGHVPASNIFFTFYYVLTGIHLLHVVIGMGLLTAWRRRVSREVVPGSGIGFAESAAAYWHMVDLLWILIFTLLYLAAR